METQNNGGGSSGMGSGSSWSWIADIFKVVSSSVNTGLAYDQANRQYKYNLYQPLAYDAKKTEMYIILIGIIVVVIFFIAYFLMNKNN